MVSGCGEGGSGLRSCSIFGTSKKSTDQIGFYLAQPKHRRFSDWPKFNFQQSDANRIFQSSSFMFNCFNLFYIIQHIVIIIQYSNDKSRINSKVTKSLTHLMLIEGEYKD